MNDQQHEYAQHSHLNQQRSQRSFFFWWRSPFFGYPFAVVLVIGALLISSFERSVGAETYFLTLPFVIVTLLVGWFWGIGPALLALLLEPLALDYWIIPPVGIIDFFQWPDIILFAPFILIQLIILGLVVVQKHYRRQLFLAHQAASTSAGELKESNRALTKSNAQLDEANHIKDQFLSRASHELKTPITTIQGQAQLALRRLTRHYPLSPEFAFLPPQLEKVEAQTHRLNTLVNDLLNLSSLRSGKVSLQIAPCDFCHICRGVVEDQAALTDCCIDLKLPPAPVILQADEGRLSQVVINLVANAIKYSPANSVIEVKVIQEGAQVILTIYNDGPAIPQERQRNLFEPFYRSPEAQTSTVQGWGLGLAISKEIIEQHSGRIWVESSEAIGTTF